MSLIDISNLTFAYEGSYDNIFENVSFQIDTDWKLGFTGRNGRGKTTFLNLLLGKYPYHGTISASVAFEYFPFEVTDKSKDALGAVEDIDGSLPRWELMRELSLLELGEEVLYRPFGTLSNGEQTKVLLAALFLKENRFLLIDEPTNHLDMHGREIVSRYLNGKEGFIVVSHDRAFLDGCIDHILSINKTNIEIQRGNFSSWLANKERQDHFELSENEKLKKDIRRLEKTAREKAAWSDSAEQRKIGFDPARTEKSLGRRPLQGAKAKKMMKRAKAIETRQQTAVEEKSKLLKNLESAEELKVTQLAYHTTRLLSLEGVSIFYGEKEACRDVGFTVERGDRVALCGKNGSGKSSILKLICGKNLAYTGKLLIGSGLKISYVPQDPSFLDGNLSDYAAEEQIDESLFKTILRKLDFSRAQFEKDLRDFSFGQKKKVLIAKSLCEKAHLLIWDEPLNYIDVLSRIQIEDLLLTCKPTILFVEHDREFCQNVATKTVQL
ncbi:MAG TPA: ABC-F type ribosomal protection protein [Oscillospiraceae bacterium]|nr:ABC-F type ribosomal protection protein [Oscillospiraceae bacterium]HRW56523.1 ABC-F type ribosomal protection protein [Oscillospiraceae bacterium]